MWGLGVAQKSGYPAGGGYHRGITRLQAIFDRDRDVQPDTRAMQLYAMALANSASPARIDKALADRPRMSSFGLAFLGLALREAKDKRSAEIASDLAGRVSTEGGLSHWPVESAWRWDFPTEGDTEATAMAAKLIAAEAPGSPLVDQAARWLLARRSRGYYWTNTKTTAFAILGLVDAVARSGEAQPDGTVSILVDGKEAWKRTWSAADALKKPESVALSLDGREGEHSIEIRKTGGSAVNASVEWLWREQSAAADSAGGLSVKRSYYRLVPAQAPGKVTYSLEPLSGPLRVGDVVAVSLSVRSTSRRQFLILEDRLPSGAETLDTFDGYEIRGRPSWWAGWFDSRELRDSSVRWYPQFLGPPGGDYTYLMRFTNAGRFSVAPARVETMYDASGRGWSDSVILEVQP
jgi:uncharacterized protein YfaS (alpha-2-macroglobulin family)